MELKGKKINFLGDSITEGYGTSDFSKCYTELIATREGAISRNYGIGGTRFAKQTNELQILEDKIGMDFCTRVYEMDEDADIIVVFGGTNDFGHGDAPFGRFENRTADTFYGATHVLCRSLLERYPDADIVFITPLHRSNENDICGDNKPYAVADLKEYVNAIREVTEYYSIPVLDLYATSQMQPEIPIIKEKFMPDGLHPNDAGHELIAKKLTAFLKAL